jgi:hypothetical protein
MPVPAHPKIYHIVHIDNLASIVGDECLWPDSAMRERQGGTVIGMGRIKQRRLSLPVSCHQGTKVGEYVPFYFCPRSIMLFVIHRANHPDLAYRGGQQPILHLEGDLHKVVQWANDNQRRWAFSLSNAGRSIPSSEPGWIGWVRSIGMPWRRPISKLRTSKRPSKLSFLSSNRFRGTLLRGSAFTRMDTQQGYPPLFKARHTGRKSR